MLKGYRSKLFIIGIIMTIGLIVGISCCLWMLISGISGAFNAWQIGNMKQFGFSLAKAILFETGMILYIPFHFIAIIIGSKD